ncbi:hypothetical protein SAMN05444339_101401 [Loktanella atrilutea]|uniref:Apea-like HEPN domain-containing protein n=1 Tax=Loktanella atrilutea TaxID=366533 RepID=A0A1M4TL05_LOKAT|nr:hypothetical protein [Loktanella atrilutea]SHE45151.1 hypothetical protein SAMN05444339_101401 [Loktanella atrilutea]
MEIEVNEDSLRKLFAEHLEGERAFKLVVDEIEDEGNKRFTYFLHHPWNDTTLTIVLSDSYEDVQEIEAILKRISFPENYSAIMHNESRHLEVFWTAFKLRKKHDDMKSRSFEVWWRGTKRICRFGAASDDALKLAGSIFPIAAPSHTEHRNLSSFNLIAIGADHHNLGEPRCFWVDCSGVEDEDLDEYLRTINFYMTYYDRETPRILIHEPQTKMNDSSRPRYVEGNFPEELVAGAIDPSVTSFWLGTFETRDPAMKFLLHYRLLEFLALSYIKEEQRKELIDILRRPHLIASTDRAAGEIATLFSGQIAANDRLKNFVKESVDAKKVWAVIDMNRAEFCDDCRFDGGYEVHSVIGKQLKFEDWKKSGPISLVDKLRAIRNCLAHGQDDVTRGVIHTTERNRRILMPWVNLIETFAAEAMLYGRQT